MLVGQREMHTRVLILKTSIRLRIIPLKKGSEPINNIGAQQKKLPATVIASS